MSFPIGLPPIEHRRVLQRSRSHTGPTVRSTLNGDEVPQTAAPTLETHPTDSESHSYLSPTDRKPRNANTLPPASEAGKQAEKTSRLHLRGPHRHHLHESEGQKRKHRYTQSEAQQWHRSRRSRDDDSLPHLVAALNAEREKKAMTDDIRSGAQRGLSKTASTRSYRAGQGHMAGAGGDAHYLSTLGDGGRQALRRRATSDPKETLRSPQKPKTEIELALERAERARARRKLTAKQADVDRRNKELKAAEDEIRDRVAEINLAGTEVTRRLDYTYYNLLEKAGDLVSMIQNFQSLSKESQQLLSNFDSETTRVDCDIRKRVTNFQADFQNRTRRGETLEKRGKLASARAEELGRRLEVASSTVEDWIQREDKSKKVWLRFWSGIWWTFVALVVTVLCIFAAKEWWFRGNPVKAGLRLPAGGSHNATLALGRGEKGNQVLTDTRVPEDVRTVLEGIETRNMERKNVFVKPILGSNELKTEEIEAEKKEDKRFTLFDEL